MAKSVMPEQTSQHLGSGLRGGSLQELQRLCPLFADRTTRKLASPIGRKGKC
jgi:hypothetical protein